ncbi:MAG: SMC family ATPase [Chloroflexota bacterium]|nr:SMC family ATPase [Chloroflexota bacterium]MCY3581665.1 SMC family ATPase [Chloroflexota bacterium]MDE2650392.1 SMC family ATPase [Chloroflexota bacterium]MXX51084.1 SMC family ATPase [Chloroflexota bacterium]MXX82791.1 SMC family ATPase [Chloroflexota bacterium]
MLPLQIELRNFLAYRAPPPISFAGIGLACLTGRNGVGKSSLLDAMTWALWGRARARRDEDLIHLGQDDMSVALDFEQAGLRYRVQRRRSRTSAGSRGALDFWVLGELGPRLINENNMRRTQAKINETLRLDYETFVHSAFLQQGRADAFTLKTAAERKRILSEILGLEQWANYESEAKTRLTTNAAEMELMQGELGHIDAEVKRAPQLQAELDSAQQALAAAQAELDQVSAAYDKVANSSLALRRENENLRELTSRIADRQSDIRAVSSEISRQQERIESCQQIITQSEEIKAGYAQLQAARNSQSALAEQLAQQQELQRRCHQLERELAEQAAALERDAHVIRERIRALQGAVSAAAEHDLADLQAQLASLESLAARRDQANRTVQALREERTALLAQQATLRSEGTAINERLERLGRADGATCPLCGGALTAQHRDDMLAQLQAQRDDMRQVYRDCNMALGEIDKRREAQERDLLLWAQRLRNMPGLQQRMGAASEHARRAQAAQADLQLERQSLQQLEARLQAENYGQELRRQLAQARAEQKRIGYDENSHDELRAKLKAYHRYDQEQTRLEFARQNLPEAQRAHAEATNRWRALQSAQAQDQAKQAQLQDSITALQEQVKLERELRDQVDQQRATVLAANERKTIAQQELLAIEAGRVNKERLEAQLGASRHQASLLSELRVAFGRDGVPAMIIDSAIPELETNANALLARMTEGRMSIALSTQRQRASGDMQETLDIAIADELGTRPYELYSGGEAFRINFALRIALSKLLAQRAGSQLRALFIDEGFGSQDEIGRASLVDAISAIRSDFDLILVITHIDDLRDSFPLHLLVEKTAEGTTVSWQ